MLKKMMNSARIHMKITPIDPLLIKSGQATVSGVDMSFVQTYRFGEKSEPYIPGSSLKGVIRSYAEKICRSIKDDPVPVCLPYLTPGSESRGEAKQASCGLRLEKYKKDFNKDAVPTSTIYRLSCPACRLFGSHAFVGRCATSDAYLTDECRKTGGAVLEIRDGVAIDRFTGGAAKGAKYDLEVLTRGEFDTSIEIRNFERWQLGLLGLVLRDMEAGLVRIGFGKSRGLGRIKAKVEEFQITSFFKPLGMLSGLGGVCSPDECREYGFYPEGSAEGVALPDPVINGLRQEYNITENWKDICQPALDDLVNLLETSTWPAPMDDFCRGGQ